MNQTYVKNNNKNSETRMITSILQQDPNTYVS